MKNSKKMLDKALKKAAVSSAKSAANSTSSGLLFQPTTPSEVKKFSKIK